MCCPRSGRALAPGDSVVCTGTHAITQADLDAGTFTDTGHATSTETDAPDAARHHPSRPDAVLALTKTDDLNPANYDTVGQVVTYTLTATNTGNITLHNVTVSDTPDLAGVLVCARDPGRGVGAGEPVACTGTHAITQADLDAGTFTDTGHATSTEADAPDAPDTIQAAQYAVFALTKTDDLNPANYDTVGQVVTYTLTATNTGNITLHNVTVSDTPDLDGFSCTPTVPVATLAPGDSVVCTGTHAITQADLDAGSFTDTGHATSTEADAPDAPDTIQAAQCAVFALTKTDDLNPANYDTVGQLVTYTLTATNTGNVTLHNVTVSDTPNLDGFSCTPDDPRRTLAPGDAVTCTGTHAITQADLDAGTFTDTGHATSTEADAPDAPDTIQAAQSAVLALTKTDDLNPANYDTVGQVVTYTLTATNTGNITLHNVTVSDTPDLDGFSCAPAIPVATLAPGDAVVCTGTHAITQADLDAGTFTDTGHATSTETDAPRRARHHPSRPERSADVDQDRRPDPRELRHRRSGRDLHPHRHQYRQRHLAQRDHLRHARPGRVLVRARDPRRSAGRRSSRSRAPAPMRSPKPTSTPARSPTPATPPAPKGLTRRHRHHPSREVGGARADQDRRPQPANYTR